MRSAHIVERLIDDRVVAGFALGEEHSSSNNAPLMCATETKTESNSERLASAPARASRRFAACASVHRVSEFLRNFAQIALRACFFSPPQKKIFIASADVSREEFSPRGPPLNAA